VLEQKVSEVAGPDLLIIAQTRDTVAAEEQSMTPMTSPPGMAEQSMPWPSPAPVHASAGGFESLHGALAGRIQIAADTDLTSPTGEQWNAEAGTI